MAEYIEREALRKEIQAAQEKLESDNDIVWEMNQKYFAGLAWAHRLVLDAPAADVAPVVHAKWIDGADSFGAKRGKYRVCSRCNICIPCVSELAAPYWRGCPNCLARMDGE